MALAAYVREQLNYGLGDRAASDELADLIDTDGNGTLSTRTKRIIRTAFGNTADGTEFINQVEAGAGLTGPQTARLGVAIASRRAASLVQAEKLNKTASVSDTVTISETIAKSLA